MKTCTRNNFKIFVRRTSKFISTRLNISEKRFLSNRRKLAAAKSDGRELVDIMPGIGMPMIIHPQMYLKIGYTTEIFEENSYYYISDVLQSGQTFVDVGANVGYFSLFASKIVGPRGRVIAFEPGEFACGLLRRNRELNRLQWLKIHQLGLGDKDETVSFNCGNPGMDVYSSLGEIRHQNAAKVSFSEIEIELRRGDNWANENGLHHIDLMKIDVEGGELQVLKGMAGILREHRVHRLLIEISRDMASAFDYAPKDIFSFVEGFGYEWFGFGPFGRVYPITVHNTIYDGMYAAVAKTDWIIK